MIARMLAACAALAMTGSWVSQARDELPTGYILGPVGSCAASGAWNIVKRPDDKVRFEMLIGSNPSITVLEVDCAALRYTQVAIASYDSEGNLVRSRPVVGPLGYEEASPDVAQVCAISRGDMSGTHGRFGSVAEFRRRSSNMDPSYFAGQPPCLRTVGPPRILSPNH